jgi:hypothetical protein
MEQYAIDQGKRKIAGSASHTIYGDEAVPASAVAQVLRRKEKAQDADDGEGRQAIDHGVAALPHDKVVPVASFVDDVKRKVALRKVMFDMKNPEKQKQEEALVSDDTLQPGQQWDKDDRQVNYRYSGNPAKACGSCKYFIAPGECEIVAGLIRPVDVCDQFEPLEEIMQRAQIRPSQLVTQDYLGEVARVILARQLREQYGYGDDDAEDCSDYERDADGRCPSDPAFDSSTAGLFDPYASDYYDAEAEGGPGSGPQPGGGKGKKYPAGPGTGSRAANKATVRREDKGGPAVTVGMKTHLQAPGGSYGMKTKEPDFRKLWDKAVRDPKFATCVAAAEDEVSPPGWSGSVMAMKKHPKITNPWALAWWMKGRGATSHYPPEKTSESTEGGPGSGPQKGGGKAKKDPAAKKPHAVMVDGGFSDSYPDKKSAKAAASNLRDKGEKATVQRVPKDMLKSLGYESLVIVDLSSRLLERMIRASAAKLVGGG